MLNNHLYLKNTDNEEENSMGLTSASVKTRIELDSFYPSIKLETLDPLTVETEIMTVEDEVMTAGADVMPAGASFMTAGVKVKTADTDIQEHAADYGLQEAGNDFTSAVDQAYETVEINIVTGTDLGEIPFALG